MPRDILNVKYAGVMDEQSSYSHRRNLLMLAVIVLVLIIGTMLSVPWMIKQLKNVDNSKATIAQRIDKIENNNEFCSTPSCIATANNILEKIDDTIDPCEDFYHFACGSWIKNVRIKHKRNQDSIITRSNKQLLDNVDDLLSTLPSNKTVEPKSIRNARLLYKSCVDEDTIKNGSAEIESFLEDEFDSDFDLINILLTLNQYNLFIFYEIQTVNDPLFARFLNSQVLKISPHIRHDNHIFNLFNQSSSTSAFSTVRDLSQTINTTFDFSNYIHRLYQLVNLTLSDNDVVFIENIESIRAISLFLARQSLADIQVYSFEYLFEHFQKHLGKKPGALACAKFVSKKMALTVTKLYISKYFDQIDRNKTLRMIDNLRQIFIQKIENISWTDKSSKQEAYDKIRTIKVHIGYPDFLNDDKSTKLEDIYADYNFGPSYFTNIRILHQLQLKQTLQPATNDTNLFLWLSSSSPLDVNAFYVESLNELFLPIGMFHTFIHRQDVPKYVTYATIGYIISHEIAHGFNSISEILTNNRSKCLIDQYNNYTVAQIDKQMDGNQTLDENLADNDGLLMAFHAYKNWKKMKKNPEKVLPGLQQYTAEQLFFISFGQALCLKADEKFHQAVISLDVHSPNEFRVKGTTSNFIEFDRAFQCKPGQGNSRLNKCHIY